MVVLPTLLPLRSWGIARECPRIPSFERRESSVAAAPSSVRVSFLPLHARNLGGGCVGRSRNLALVRSLAATVRMSSAASEPPPLAAKDDSGEKATKTVNVIIRGQVQGVYYRNWTVDAAQQLGVNGWVRNLKDGSVEAVFSGNAAAVDSLVDKCHAGPSAARVSGVEVSAWKEEVPQGFQRKPTIW